MKARLDGKIGPMPAEHLQDAVAERRWRRRAREWVGQASGARQAAGRHFKLSSRLRRQRRLGRDDGGAERVLADARRRQSRVRAARRMAGAGGSARAAAARGHDARDHGARMPPSPPPTAAGSRSKARFTVDMQRAAAAHGPVRRSRRRGRCRWRSRCSTSEPLQRRCRATASSLAGIDGKVDAQLTIALPLGGPLEPRDVKVEGKARISDGRLKQALGPYDMHGANIAVDMTATAVEAKGEMLVNGVLAKASWQHVFGAPPDKQPPLRITASARQQRPHPARPRPQRPRAGRGRRRGDGRRAMRAASAACTCAPISSMPSCPRQPSPGASPRAGRASSSSICQGQRLSDRAAQRQAGRRQCRHRGLDGHRRR